MTDRATGFTALVMGRTWCDVLADVPQLPIEGRFLRARAMGVQVGGVGRPAIVLAALGIPTVLRTPFADDVLGQQCRAELDGAGVIVEATAVAGMPTSLVLTGGVDRTVVSHRSFGEDVLDQLPVPTGVRLLVGDGSEVDAFTAAADHVHARGGLVTCDVGLTVRDRIAEAVAASDLVVGHREVLTHLAGTGDPAAAADALVARDGGPQVVVRTMGGDGCWVHTASGRSHHRAVAVDAVDTCGCGDVFHAALAGTLAKGCGLDEAVTVATKWAGRHAAVWGNLSLHATTH